MELKARGSENRHIPAWGSVNSGGESGAVAMTSWPLAACGGERTDNDELPGGKRGILGVERHGGGGAGAAEKGELCLGGGEEKKAKRKGREDGNQGFWRPPMGKATDGLSTYQR